MTSKGSAKNSESEKDGRIPEKNWELSSKNLPEGRTRIRRYTPPTPPKKIEITTVCVVDWKKKFAYADSRGIVHDEVWNTDHHHVHVDGTI